MMPPKQYNLHMVWALDRLKVGESIVVRENIPEARRAMYHINYSDIKYGAKLAGRVFRSVYVPPIKPNLINEGEGRPAVMFILRVW